MINYKNNCFYNKAHLNICSICCVFIAEIWYFQIEPGGKKTHANESMMLKMFYLSGFVRWTKRAFDEL